MKYFFILGNNPTLSVAELSAVFGLSDKKELPAENLIAGGGVLLLETNEEINARHLIKNLGGTIKIGLVHDESDISTADLLSKITPHLKPAAGKFNFGLSFYGRRKFYSRPLGMEIKKHLRGLGLSCRWVVSREKTLSSVVVEQNKLTAGGIEIVLVEKGGKILVGQTLAVQPFKELSFRDYGRPARDDRSGMLPPKLAQIMINLAQADKNNTILDPFCGSGTILTEAALMGYKNLLGADISKKAVEDTEKNMNWLKSKYPVPDIQYQLHNITALELSKIFESRSIDLIITEPYLGPQRGHFDVKETSRELTDLYSRALKEFAKILKPGGRIVMIWPVFHAARDSRHITPDIKDFRVINPLPESWRDNHIIELTGRDTIIYGRSGQKVWREIVILELV